MLAAAAAADRLITRTPAADGLPALVISSIAALVMAAAALFLHGDGNDSDGDAGERTCQSRRSCSTPSPMRPRQRAWPHQADHPGDRRLVLARPSDSARHRSRNRLSCARALPAGRRLRARRACGEGGGEPRGRCGSRRVITREQLSPTAGRRLRAPQQALKAPFNLGALRKQRCDLAGAAATYQVAVP